MIDLPPFQGSLVLWFGSMERGHRMSRADPSKLICMPAIDRVAMNGEIIRLGGQKLTMVIALFARPLCLVTEEWLAEWFWRNDPSGGPENASNVIKQQIHYLRPILARLGLGINTRWGQGYTAASLPPIAYAMAAE